MGLIQAGGIDTTGTLREIKIKRSNSLIETIDFYDYLINGNMPKNTQLRDGDVIIVPNRLSSVIIDSSIARPGIYETNGRENLKEIIFYAGGFSTNASNKISIERLSKGLKNNIMTTKNFYVDAIDAVNHKIMNGDVILPLSIVPSVNKVEIIGQIKRPGSYNYYDGMTVIDLLELGGGFYDPTYRKSIYMAAAEIVRRDPNTKFEKIIKVNLNDIAEKS
jgi:Periplasmic protein involved in polysaccharide export